MTLVLIRGMWYAVDVGSRSSLLDFSSLDEGLGLGPTSNSSSRHGTVALQSAALRRL